MDGLEELLGAITQGGMNKAKEDFIEKEKAKAEGFSIEKQIETLRSFAKAPDLQVGDRVVLNAFGKEKLKFPNDYRPGIVTEVFSEPKIDDDGCVIHGAFAVAFADDNVRVFTQDFRYLTKAD